MNQKNNGGPAFPLQAYEQWGGGEIDGVQGMTLRDYFAAAAVQGLLASNAMYGGRTDDRASLATDAYATADAMLAERAK